MSETRENLQSLAYRRLRELILDNVLKPGEPLAEKQLIVQLGIGRTPLREAIQQLRNEGILDVLPRCGTFVRAIDLDDVVAIYQVRMALEPEIARIATGMAERKILQGFKNMFTSGSDKEDMFRADARFHSYLCESTRNSYFIRAMETVWFQDQRIRKRSTHALKDMTETNETHIEILDCMLKLDARGAREAMQRHIEQSQTTALSLTIDQLSSSTTMIPPRRIKD